MGRSSRRRKRPQTSNRSQIPKQMCEESESSRASEKKEIPSKICQEKETTSSPQQQVLTDTSETKETPESSALVPTPLPDDILANVSLKGGELIWVETDDEYEYYEDFGDGWVPPPEPPTPEPPLVIYHYGIYFENIMAEKEHRNDLRKRRVEAGQKRSTKRKGQWYCVIKNFTSEYCAACKKDTDHIAAVCPFKDGYPVERPFSFCNICMRGGHPVGGCPYLKYVPRDKQVGPGGIKVCRCCYEENAHSGDDWYAWAIMKECNNCGAICEHSTEKCYKPKVENSVYDPGVPHDPAVCRRVDLPTDGGYVVTHE